MSGETPEREVDWPALPSLRRGLACALLALAVGLFVSLVGPVGERTDPAVHASDFASYAEAAVDVREHHELYDLRPQGYLYPPLLAVLLAPFTTVAVAFQARVWLVLGICGLVLSLREMLRFAEPVAAALEPRARTTALVALGLAGVAAINPIGADLRFGNVGVPMLSLLVLGYFRAQSDGGHGRRFLGGLLLAIPPAIKLTTALPVLAALIAVANGARRGRRHPRAPWWPLAGFLVGSVLGWFVIPSLALGWRGNLAELQAWRERLAPDEQGMYRGDQPFVAPPNQALGNALHLFQRELAAATGRPVPPLRAPSDGVALPLLLLGVLYVLAAARWLRSDSDSASAAFFGFACLLAAVASPVAWHHHYVVILPAASLFGTWLCSVHRERRALAFVSAITVVVVASYAWLARFGLLGIGAALWLAAACLAVVLSRPDGSAERARAQPPEET